MPSPLTPGTQPKASVVPLNQPAAMQARFTMKPTRTVLFLRTFWLYQLWRFARVNLRMMSMIGKSHPRRRPG